MNKTLLFFLLLFLTSSYKAHADNYNIFSNEEEIEEEVEIYDPFEKINRKFYSFNMTLDKYTLRPAAKLYRNITSKEVRKSVTNFTTNLTMPFTIVNSLLQGDIKNFTRATGSFVINSTIGILGIFDPAHQNIKMKRPNREDFGQTLAKYKIGPGPYLIIPFMGPYTLRHISGQSAEWAYNPVWKDGLDEEEKLRYSITALNIVNKREKLLEYLDDIEKNSLDPYTVVKSAYYQRRLKLINNETN